MDRRVHQSMAPQIRAMVAEMFVHAQVKTDLCRASLQAQVAEMGFGHFWRPEYAIMSPAEILAALNNAADQIRLNWPLATAAMKRYANWIARRCAA